MKLQFALHLLFLTSFSSTISHLLSLPQSVNLLTCSLDATPVCQLLYCTTVLLKTLYCKIKNVFFTFSVYLLLCYYLFIKYYKPIIVQYYIADCVSWIPKLTLLDLLYINMYNIFLQVNTLKARKQYFLRMALFGYSCGKD